MVHGGGLEALSKKILVPFWTSRVRLVGRVGRGTFSNIFTKNSPNLSILDKVQQSKHTFQSIFHALRESNNKNKRRYFLTELDHTLGGAWRWSGGSK